MAQRTVNVTTSPTTGRVSLSGLALASVATTLEGVSDTEAVTPAGLDGTMTAARATNDEAYDATSTVKVLTPANFAYIHSAIRAKLKTTQTNTERTTAINAAIDEACGSGNPLSTTRTASRGVEIPSGSWGIDSPVVGRSALGLHVDGKGECELVAKSNMTALIDFNGVRNGGVSNLQLRGTSGVTVDVGLWIYWDNVASSSPVTGMRFEEIWVRNLDFIDGIRVGKVGSTPAGAQVDNCSFWHCLVNGLNTTEAYGSGSRYVNAIKLGNGTFGNNYGHHLYHCNVNLCQFGVRFDATMGSIFGGDTGSNGVDYYINPGGYIEVNNVRSEHSKRLLTTAGPSSGANNILLRNITYTAVDLHADGILIDYRLSGHLDLLNVSIGQPPIAPILSTNTAGNPLKVMIEGGGIRGSSTYTDPLVTDFVAGAASGTIVEWKDFAISNSAGAIQRVVSGASPAINAQTGTTYTFVNADQYKLVTLSNAGAITATIPPNSSVPYAIGTKLRMMQLGAGAVTVAPGAGVTINGDLVTRAQYSQVVAEKRATDTWFMSGDGMTLPAAYTQTFATADRTHAARTAVALTDSSGGTANTTVQALTDPADTPASADALRDDLVANLIPQLRNNYADLADQHNKLVADLADTAELLNSVIDDLQTRRILQ